MQSFCNYLAIILCYVKLFFQFEKQLLSKSENCPERLHLFSMVWEIMGRYTSTSKGFYAFYQIYEDTAGRTGETAETVDHNSRILLKFIQIV
jgi:hypothetical protein